MTVSLGSMIFGLLALLSDPEETAATLKVADPRLAVEIVATQPDIVTPTGLAVDTRGRVYVVESNTHFRPDDYQGPKTDRIRRFEGRREDGRAAKVSTFFEGSTYTMGLAFHPDDGSLFVATRYEIFKLTDRDDDGVADGPPSVLIKLDTAGDYPHNGLSGVSFDIFGRVYFGLGENLGASYKLIGRDGITLEGGGEGGNIYRCQPDGTKLERLATGFWNPFHTAFDAFGNLFAIDNDPDSRPPCRLLHIVQGGDYGYRFRNGRKGLHPFTAWNGELPGTLPMAAGTGEAPSGLISYESDNLPSEYVGNILVTSWGDHRIERFKLKWEGATFKGTAEPLISGGENFRPVAIATAPDGSIYFSDWVDKSYKLHGMGKVWRIFAKNAPTRVQPKTDLEALVHFDRPIREAAAMRLAKGDKADRDLLVEAVKNGDSLRARAAALEALAVKDPSALDASIASAKYDMLRVLAVRDLPEFPPSAIKDLSTAVRAEALRRTKSKADRDAILASLDETDPFLRQAAREALKRTFGIDALIDLFKDKKQSTARRLGALLVLRESKEGTAMTAIPEALEDSDPSIRFVGIRWVGEERLERYRSTLKRGLTETALTRQIFEATLAALDRLDNGQKGSRDEAAGEETIAALIQDPSTPDELIARALRAIRSDHPSLTLEKLDGFLHSKSPVLRLEAVRTLRESPLEGKLDRLQKIADDSEEPVDLRAEAVTAIAPDSSERKELLGRLATSNEPILQREALRSLGQVDPLLSPPASLDDWVQSLEGASDPLAGERLFFSAKGPGCFRCHQMDGRGGQTGPDLSTTGAALTRRRLIESIVEPSKEIAPQFVAWNVARKDGTLFTGTLIQDSAGGEQVYADANGNLIKVATSDVETRSPQTTSIMPSDLAKTMTLQDFRDLAAYLQHPR